MEKRRGIEVLQVQEYIVHTVLLTAGAAASLLMVFLMEQWRAWVFIVLNLILLAVLFTSVSSPSNETQQCCNNSGGAGEENLAQVAVKVEKRETSQCVQPSVQIKQEVVKELCDEEEWFEVENLTEEEEEVPKLSKEALNERVEAFIVMFRQHLVSDARN